MAGEEVPEASGTRRRMDLNLYLGLQPLPRPPVWLDTPMISPTLTTGAAPEAPTTEESLAPAAAAYSPSNALSTPEEHPMLDPIVYSWLDGNSTDGEEDTDAPEPDVSRSHLLVAATRLEGDDLPVVRFVRPSRVAARGMEMVNTSIHRRSDQGAAAIEAGTPELRLQRVIQISQLRRSDQGAAAIEAGTPELRLQRVIQISQQHSIVRPALVNRSEGGDPTDDDRLVLAIQRTHNSLQAARRQKLDDGKVCGNGAAKKDGHCDCNSSFECNICLDPAKTPVVTPCGHLFCWPCLYQWLHAHSRHSECPVCKGEVLEVNVTPIYGRGGEEGNSTNLDLPPRPRAKRTESLRQQLQMADTRGGFETVVRQLMQNQGIVGGFPNPTGIEMNVVPAGRQRARARRQQRQDNNASPSTHVVAQNMGNVASESSNQIQLPHSNGDNAAQMVLAASQQSSSVEQLSTSSTTAVIVGEPGSSRRSRPSESPTIRRTRRRQQ